MAGVKSSGAAAMAVFGKRERCGEFGKDEEDIDAHEKQAHRRESSGPESNLLLFA